MEVGCQILQSLLCFENDEKLNKTIACQGNTSFTYIREKLNHLKQKLVEIPQFSINDPAEEEKNAEPSSPTRRRSS
jgi:hypothetical protein